MIIITCIVPSMNILLQSSQNPVCTQTIYAYKKILTVNKHWYIVFGESVSKMYMGVVMSSYTCIWRQRRPQAPPAWLGLSAPAWMEVEYF